MELPICSLKYSNLTIGKKADVSANSAKNSFYIDENKMAVTGWFKKCNKGKYPVFLAKFAVAASVRVRLAMGEEAAEEMLVFDDNNEIVGTFSREIKDFKPLERWLSWKSQKSQTPKLQDLIESAAKYLISRWIHFDNDGHPDNWSLDGIIDYDEFFYSITSIIKYGKPVFLKLTLEELMNFPFVLNRDHWPTQFPYKFWRAFSTDAFSELKGNAAFKQQCYAALLKECLAFDKKVLQTRLRLYLGDLSVDLGALPDFKKMQLLEFDQRCITEHMEQREDENELKQLSPYQRRQKHDVYAQEYSLFYDASKKERAFIDFCARYFEDENQKLLDLILHFNEFKDYLIKVNTHLNDMQDFRTWFTQNNVNNNAPHNLVYSDQLFHIMWRECFESAFNQCMQALVQDMQKILYSDGKSPKHDDSIIIVHKPKREYIRVSRNILKSFQKIIDNYFEKNTDLQVSDNHLFINVLKKEINRKIFKYSNIHTDTQDTLHKLQLTNPLNSHNDFVKNEIDKKLQTQEFTKNIVFVLNNFNKHISQVLKTFQLNENIGLKIPLTTTPHVKEFKSRHFSPALELSQTPTPPTGSFLRHGSSLRCVKLPQPTSVVTETNTPEKISHPDLLFDHKKNVTNLKTAIEIIGYRLKTWLKTANDGDIYNLKHRTIHKEYLRTATFRTYKKGDEELSLEEIFSKSGKYGENSLKTFLIKNLCLTMLQDKEHLDLKKIIFAQTHYDKTIFWAQFAENIAKTAGLEKIFEPAPPGGITSYFSKWLRPH